MAISPISSQETQLRALIVEDDHLYACIIGEMLKEGSLAGSEVTLTYTLAQALAELPNAHYDVILLDMMLPDSEGDIDAIPRLQAVAPHVPIIMMTNMHNEALAMFGLQAGAQDYLIKGQFRVQGLIRAIRYARERQRLRLALEASLRQEIASGEERFQRMITESADGVVIVNQMGLIEFVNPAAEALFGNTAADLLGQPFGYEVKAGHTAELRFERPAAELAIAETRPVETQWAGNPALLITLRDITAHKRAEAALRRYTLDLQARNEELDAFAHTVAHDLKTPLGVMLGFAEVLEMDYKMMPREEMANYLRNIARSTRKADYIIKELLLLSSVRKEDVEPRPLYMGDIVHEVQERLAQMIETTGAQLILPTQWPVSMGHAPWIEEVWANYISNAIKYGGRPPRVEIGTTRQANDVIVFWVTDNGHGLTAEERARLFTPFTQLNKVRAQGNGLGLSIVRRIVDRLDGKVGVRSEAGQGSTFFFTLPAAKEKMLSR